MISKLDNKNFLNAYLETFDLEQLEEGKCDRHYIFAKKELEEILGLNEQEVKEARYQHMKISGVKPEDYTERLISMGDNRQALVGIRHAGQNVNMPFLSIWPSFEIRSINDLTTIFQASKEYFEKFKPKYLQLWTHPNSVIAKKIKDIATPRLNHVVGKLSSILKTSDSVNLPNNFRIEKVEDNNFYEWYSSVHNKFLNENPKLRDWAPMNDYQDMNQNRENGLLWYLYNGNKIAGLIEAERDEYLGTSSIYMCEILLDKPYRGKGLAPSFQIEFLRKTNSKNDYVWGTIDSKNTPSLKTAFRVGRRCIRSEYFVPISNVI